MFPIADRQGRTVAFGGRFLPVQAAGARTSQGERGEPPKYINSPELGIYKKGETLFAVDLALPEIRRTKTAYIVEGYMDVIALHQAGITNAVAPLGTAFTEDQAKLLRRWAEKVILFFDTDDAGQTATVKGIFTCRKNGLACAVIAPLETPNDKDPADILKDLGPEALQKKAKCFINDFDYLIARAKLLYDNKSSSSIQGKAQAVAFLFPYIDLLGSEVARDSCIDSVADAFGLLPVVVADDYRRYASDRGAAKRPLMIKEEHTPIRMNDELLMLIAAAVDYVSSGKEKLFPTIRAALEISEIEDQNAKEVFVALEECIRYGETGMDELLARISSQELREYLVQRSASGEFSVNSPQLIADGIKKIKGRRLERRQEEIIVKLRELKKEDQNTDSKELLAEKMRIDSELFILKQGR